jgi:hypothetical protein
MFKEFIKDFVPKLLEFIFVVALGFVAYIVVSTLLNEVSLGIACVAVVFYYFGGIIRPYIMELVKKFTKNLGKDEENN